jgi:hypothetical protein
VSPMTTVARCIAWHCGNEPEYNREEGDGCCPSHFDLTTAGRLDPRPTGVKRRLVSVDLDGEPRSQVGVRFKHHSTRTRHREQVAIPRGLRGVGRREAVGAMIVEEVFKVGEKGHCRQPAPVVRSVSR